MFIVFSPSTTSFTRLYWNTLPVETHRLLLQLLMWRKRLLSYQNLILKQIRLDFNYNLRFVGASLFVYVIFLHQKLGRNSSKQSDFLYVAAISPKNKNKNRCQKLLPRKTINLPICLYSPLLVQLILQGLSYHNLMEIQIT